MKYILFLLLSSCGMTIHSDPIRVDPIKITYNVDVNLFNEIMNYCNNLCINSNLQTQEEVNSCSQKCIQQMLNQITVPLQTP